ncbi:PqqD family protein [Guptibacillus algicola]|uniref:PqqD family protein n=1 Tax=Guptibacillus algicola TaxID=225844 RepID=UPI001CD514D4|nr:PqqD family protein [Alkalihalobacillus algicola]MCA0989032.1 PqqD family protein [Alkalihalobacillus algicola]
MNLQSSILLNEFKIHNSQNEYIVEIVKAAEYYEMNESAVEALKLIDQGKNLKEVERILLEQFPSDEIDVLDFVEQLVELGFISGDESREISVSNNSLFNKISPTLAQSLFNSFSYKLYLLLFLVNIALLTTHLELLPHYSDFFVSNSLAVSMMTYLFLSLIMIFIHEMGHVMAVRSHDLPTNLSISHRLFLVVIETDMTHAWRLSRRERNHLYLSGICFDTVLFFGATLTQLFVAQPWVQAVASLIMLDLFIKFIYQCCVYMKTDFYYVLENTSGCYNLMERSKEWLLRRSEDIRSKREQFILGIYGVIYIIGIGFSISLFVFYVIPQLRYMVQTSLNYLSYPVGSMYFWDGFVVLAQIALGVGLLLFTWSRTLKNRS